MDRKNSNAVIVQVQDVGFTWNTKHDELLTKWKTYCQYYSKLHDLSAERFTKYHNWVGIPTKFLLSLIVVIEFHELSSQQCANNWNFYFNGFVALSSIGFETVRDFLAWSTRSTKHLAASATYDKLNMNIELELCHPFENRTNVRAFMRHVKATMQGLKESSPSIPNDIQNQYIENFNFDRENHSKELPEEKNNTNFEEIDSQESDLQDEFAAEMQRRLEIKQNKALEEYQLQRLND